MIEAGERAAGHIADDVAAGPLGGEADLGQGVGDFDEVGDGEPVKLNVLAGGDVGVVAGKLLGDAADDAKLVAGEQAIGDGDAHHKKLGGFAFAALAAGEAEAVALRIDAPPAEVESPLLGNRVAAIDRKLADLVKGFPWIFGELEAFGLLGLGLFDGGRVGAAGVAMMV